MNVSLLLIGLEYWLLLQSPLTKYYMPIKIIGLHITCSEKRRSGEVYIRNASGPI